MPREKYTRRRRELVYSDSAERPNEVKTGMCDGSA